MLACLFIIKSHWLNCDLFTLRITVETVAKSYEPLEFWNLSVGCLYLMLLIDPLFAVIL